MASTFGLRRGERLSLLPADARGGGFEATVRAIGADGSLHLDRSQAGASAASLAPGDEVLLLARPRGRLYRMRSRVRLLDGPTGALVLEPPSEPEHAERRDFFRLMTSLQPRYAAVVDEDGAELERLDVSVLDLSGGGMQLRTKQAVERGARLRLVDAFDRAGRDLDVTLTALSVVPPEPGRTYYRVHGQFVGISRADQERIVRFVFRQQAEQQRRRAL